MKNVKPIVDDKPPRLDVFRIYDEHKLKNEMERLKIIFEINEDLLKIINHIDRFGGRTDTFGFDYKRTINSNYEKRKSHALLIEHQNKLILKGLLDVVSLNFDPLVIGVLLLIARRWYPL